MEEVIIFMIFIICFLGVWVTRLSRKITQLEYEICTAQLHFEKEYREVLIIMQNSAEANRIGYTELTKLVSKQVTDDMENMGNLESKFNNLEKYVFESVRIITNEIEKNRKKTEEQK